MPIARQTALPCTVAEIKEGGYLDQPQLPSGVATPRGLASRASLMGIVVEAAGGSLVLDDGTGSVRAQGPERAATHVSVGDAALVIGKPREFNGERYLELEIAKRLRSRGWIAYRRAELGRFSDAQRPAQRAQAAPQTPKSENPLSQIIDAIRELDRGSGADTADVLSRVAHPDKERLLRVLLEEGEIFEIKPGKVKVLE
jgi:hypothetical protein